jgi:hypothetical protein
MGRGQNSVFHKLVIDGCDVGFPLQKMTFTRSKSKGERLIFIPAKYPQAIEVLSIELSNGKRVILASEEVRYLTATQMCETKRREGTATSTLYLPTKAEIGERTYAYDMARHLQPGQVVEWEQPFRSDLVRRVVTNGEVEIPFRRPRDRAEWSLWPKIAPLKGINECNWALMLEVVVGLYLDEVLDLVRLNQRIAVARRRQQEQEEVCKCLDQLLQGQCYDVAAATSVSVGENLIFSLTLEKGERRHLVDSPEYGRGLYVFYRYEDAHAWASRAIDFKEVRQRALAFIPHREGWRERLNELLVRTI